MLKFYKYPSEKVFLMQTLPHILIAQSGSAARNYEAVMEHLAIPYTTTLSTISKTTYDMLLLPGGGDISPDLYHCENCGSRNIEPQTDLAQLSLLDDFIRRKKPVLGICKGFQLIQIYFGGALVQDLQPCRLHYQPPHDVLHKVRNQKSSFLEKLYGPVCTVNSFHHQAVLSPAPGLEVLQTAPDHVIEAMRHSVLPILGFQWHPERLCLSFRRPDAIDGLALFQSCLISLFPNI